jgi:tetratricopeptide (TPR) repeat protein
MACLQDCDSRWLFDFLFGQRLLAQGKTSNELAIAYAQLSGDTALKGGTIGHLAHFYLRQEPDLAQATHYLNEALPFAQGNNALTGWLSLLQASIDAKAGQARQCEKDLAYAMDRARALPQSPEYSDIYYTDFSLVSAQAFCVNCWLTIGNPTKAQACFTELNLADLSENRQASTLYDVSRLYAALGDFNLVQTYALRAIDKAVKTHQLYVIARCRKLATTILEREGYEPHATAILEYAQMIQEHYKRSINLC